MHITRCYVLTFILINISSWTKILYILWNAIRDIFLPDNFKFHLTTGVDLGASEGDALIDVHWNNLSDSESSSNSLVDSTGRASANSSDDSRQAWLNFLLIFLCQLSNWLFVIKLHFSMKSENVQSQGHNFEYVLYCVVIWLKF